MSDLRTLGAEVLARGELSSGHMCPRCGGGAKRESSLSVWPHTRLPGFVVAKCWRNKCGYSEDVLVGADAKPAGAVRRMPAPVPLMQQLSEAAAAYMAAKYRISRPTLDYWKVRQHVSQRALYFPVMSPRRELRGYVLRKFAPEAKPKAENIKLLPEQPFLAWLRHPIPRRIVIVEDYISGLRAWVLGYTAAVLCGTSIGEDKLEEIKRASRVKGSPILLALDVDAISKALVLSRRDHVPIQPVRLWRDLKDCTDGEIAACLQ